MLRLEPNLNLELFQWEAPDRRVEMSKVEVRDLSVELRRGWGTANVLKAVDGVSLSIESGETLGLVGESAPASRR